MTSKSWQHPKEALNKSAMNRVAVKNAMIARRATPVVLNVRGQGAQRRKRAFLTQPARDKALRAVCGVRLLVKGAHHSLRARRHLAG